MAKSEYMKENEFPYSLKKFTSNSTIYLSIIVGEGQYGNSSFKNFNGEIVTGSVLNRILGKKKDIINKSLEIITVVTDTSPHTNHTSVTYKINNNEAASYDYDVPNDNGTLFYKTTINFN